MKAMLQAIYKSIEETGWNNDVGDTSTGPCCFIGHQTRTIKLGLCKEPEIVSDYIATFIPAINHFTVKFGYVLGSKNLEANGMNKEKALAIIATAIAALPGDDSEIDTRPSVQVHAVAQDRHSQDVQREVSRLELETSCDR